MPALMFAVSKSMMAEYRRTMLRGPLMNWWAIVRGDIEERTARDLYERLGVFGYERQAGPSRS